MLELLLCSAVTVLPDFLYRRYAQGRRLGYEIVTHRLELYGRRIRGR